MSISIDSFKQELKQQGIFVYDNSVDLAAETVCAMVRKNGKKCLAVKGSATDSFDGTEENGIKYCDLTVPNSKALHVLFPYTKPQSHASHKFTFGLGDRLGLATPGQVRALKGYDVFPVLAQQSIRELTLTNRTFEDVIASASFGVFQEGYKGGYGADGDHLKTKEEILNAISSGCTMITMDCSAKIHADAESYTKEKVDEEYPKLPADLRKHYEDTYLNKSLPVIGKLSEDDLKKIVLVFSDAIDHAESCYKYIDEIKTVDVDFELSIDETPTVTTPEEHFVISNELINVNVHPVSVAPHFSGEFEKGIDYAGCLDDFARDFDVHQKIADHFGYKLSLHSGSDKFTVFSTVGRVTKGHVHVKTAGTNWLEAMRVVAQYDPELYRKAHKYAIEHRPEAEKYYHVTTKTSDIQNIDLQSDEYLPEYLQIPASRQTIHITYGLLLNEKWFRDAFFKFMDEHEEDYYAGIVSHIGRHLKYLNAQI